MTTGVIVNDKKELYNRLFLSPDFSDVTLLVNQKKHPSHKFIMSAQSKYFQSRLYGANQHVKELEVKLRKPTDEALFLKILKYMYSGLMDLKNVHLSDCTDIIEYAHDFQLDILEKGLTDRMMPYIKTTNVYMLLEDVKKRGLQSIRRKCLEFLSEHADSVCKTERFYDLSFEDFCDFLEFKPALSAIRIFEVVKAWLEKHENCTKDEKARVLSNIEFSQLTVQNIKETVEPAKLFEESHLLDLLRAREQRVRGKLSSLKVENGKIAISYQDKVANAIKMGNIWLILVDLGKNYIINHIKFCLTEQSSYCIEGSCDNETFFTIIDYLDYCCQKEQTLFFEEVTTRYVKIYSHKKFGCDNFHVSYQSKPKEFCEKFLAPLDNAATPNRAWAHVYTDASKILSWDFNDYGKGTPYVAFEFDSYKSLQIKFFQPYWLGSCRLRLWDFDDRKYCFRVGYKATSKEKTFREIKSFKWANGWQHIEFTPRPVCAFIIEAQNSSKGNDFRLVYFEAPSQQVKKGNEAEDG